MRRALHGQLRDAIVGGRLAPGVQLPASRALAVECGLSRNTVLAVYDMLLGEGHVVARPGAGTFVAPPPPRAERIERDAQTRRTEFDMRAGLPDSARFPFDIWGRLTGRTLRAFARASAGYRAPAGHPALREAIAGHASFARAMACDPEAVVVTAGAQQAFELLARVLVTPERPTVAVEDPGYPATRAAFAAAGARVLPVPVDGDGLVVDLLPPEAAIVCVTPAHQFPLGMPMSPPRRAALLAWAGTHDAVIVEDDYGGEFRFEARPLDTLWTLDRDARVFYVGTFSQRVLRALRMGFVAAPERARRALADARALGDWHGPAIEQGTLAAFIAEGHLARHIRRMRRIYAGRRAVLLDALLRHGSDVLKPIPALAGLHVTARARAPIDAKAVVARAAERGVAIGSLDGFRVDARGADALLFGYGLIEAERIDEAVARVVSAIRAQRENPC